MKKFRLPVLFLLACTCAFAQSKRPMTFEDMMKMRRLGDIAVSPDGHWVLFAVTDVDLAKNTRTSHLWIVPTAGGDEKPLTDSMAGESRGRFRRMAGRSSFKARAMEASRYDWLHLIQSQAQLAKRTS
jgi:dipeptidyl aminopeptidase/acylaminoacyl peptidase